MRGKSEERERKKRGKREERERKREILSNFYQNRIINECAK